MVHVNDVLGIDADVRREEYKLRGEYRLGNIEPADFEGIWDCYQALADSKGGWGAATTKRSRLSQLRLSAVEVDSLLGFEGPSDVEDLVSAHSERIGEDPAATTLNGYIQALKSLFEWADAEPGYGDYSWSESIRRRERSRDRKDPEEMLNEDDIARLREHAKFGRERAFIEFVADTGLRRTAALQLRIKDIDLEAESFRVNPDGAAQKGVEDYEIGRWPLKDSPFWLRGWINQDHPEAPNPHPDAPLFPKVEGYYPERREECAASPKAVGHQIRTAAERADIEKPVGLHSFRHACVKRLRWKYEFEWETIRDRLAWSEESLGEMMNVYGRLDADERIERMREQYGIPTSEDDDEAPAYRCPNCGSNEAKPHLNLCPQCKEDISDWDPRAAEPGIRFEMGEDGPRLIIDGSGIDAELSDGDTIDLIAEVRE